MAHEPEVRTRIVKDLKKNGDTYVLERKMQYDPEKKYERVLSTKLLGKIPKGETEMVPTRPKRPNGSGKVPQPKKTQVLETGEDDGNAMRVGMTDILQHISKESGIEERLIASTQDINIANKTLSLAWFLVGGHGAQGMGMPSMHIWQERHYTPYGKPISEDMYRDLFLRIGLKRSICEDFFKMTCESMEDKDALILDSTTIGTYSESLNLAKQGHNKDGDGLDVVKFDTVYGLRTMQPIAFALQPGNIPDVICVDHAMALLTQLGMDLIELILDNGYCSDDNLAAILLSGRDFITRVKVSCKWVKDALDEKASELNDWLNCSKYDGNVNVATKTLIRPFPKERNNRKKDDMFDHPIYLHLYLDPNRRNEKNKALRDELINVITKLEGNQKLEKREQSLARSCIITDKINNTVRAFIDRDAYAEKCKYNGYFALAASAEKDPDEALRKYRSRGTVECFYRDGKQFFDLKRPRVQSDEMLLGRTFVIFIALCIWENFTSRVNQIKQELSQQPEHDTRTIKEKQADADLKKWLDRTSYHGILMEFDNVEEVSLQATDGKIIKRRTPMTSRLKLFLRKLGMDPK